jgi:GT2 family glycosyltransferase
VNDQDKHLLTPDQAFGGRPLSVGIQSVLFNNELAAVDRSLAAVARAAELAVAAGLCTEVSVHYGDCSSSACLTDKELSRLRERYGRALRIDYRFFNENLGHAGGQNRISASNAADMILIQNPDVVVSPRLFEVMLSVFVQAGVGVVEAKQLPIEHPKDYDPRSGETGWASGACVMIPAPLFRQLGGFDADSFFMQCDDVDFSWRVRLAGFKIIFQPAAAVMHDKRLAKDGGWQPTEAEKYYSAEAALLLAYKWSRPDLTAEYLEHYKQSSAEHLLRAAREFEKRQAEGRLPEPIDSEHRIGRFNDGLYAKHRFPL